MSDTLMFDPDQLQFMPNPTIAGDESAFVTIHVSLAKILASYRKSLFAHEWLDADGAPKSLDALNPAQRTQRRTIENTARMGNPLPMPVLGIGMLDCVEVGAGRDVLLTLAAAGVQTMPVHIPSMMSMDFQKFVAAEKPRRKTESGSAIVYILIAIVILAALSVAVSRTTNFGSGGMVSEGRTKADAAEIMAYGNALKIATSKLLLRGCTLETLNYYYNSWPYSIDNYDAPADKSCNIFDAAGAGMIYKTPPPSVVSAVGTAWYGVNGVWGIQDVGDNTKAELTFTAHVTKEMCVHMNNLLGIENPSGNPPNQCGGQNPADDGMFIAAIHPMPHHNNFTAFWYNVGSGMNSQGYLLDGRLSACYRSGSGCGDSQYVYYQVLIVR